MTDASGGCGAEHCDEDKEFGWECSDSLDNEQRGKRSGMETCCCRAVWGRLITGADIQMPSGANRHNVRKKNPPGR